MICYSGGMPCFVALDLLHYGATIRRSEQLVHDKHKLRRLIGAGLGPVVFADRIERLRTAVFELRARPGRHRGQAQARAL